MTADGTFFNRHKSGSQSVQVVHFISADYTTYYRILERTQKGTTDVTDWMLWFVACLGRAIDDAETTVSAALDRARFWERIAGVPLNDRQRQVLTLLVDDFQGPLTTSRWARITHCSQDTALRDITDLVERGVLVRGAGCGRSTSYGLGGPDVIPV